MAPVNLFDRALISNTIRERELPDWRRDRSGANEGESRQAKQKWPLTLRGTGRNIFIIRIPIDVNKPIELFDLFSFQDAENGGFFLPEI